MIEWDAPVERRKSARTASRPAPRTDLRAIPFEPLSLTPLPEIWESDTEFAWLEFDAAKMSMDLATQAGRTEYAELMNAPASKRSHA